MQEDKSPKWLADQLRKQQEENQLPYELGAWEAFESRRAAITGKKSNYWISGIAASVTLLLMAGALWLTLKTDGVNSQLSEQIALGEQPTANSLQETTPAGIEATAPELTESPVQRSAENQETTNSVSSPISKAPYQSTLQPRGQSTGKSVDQTVPKSTDLAVARSTGQATPKSTDQTTLPKPGILPVLEPEIGLKEGNTSENLAVIKKPVEEENPPTTTVETLAAASEKSEVKVETPLTTPTAEIAQAELPKEPQLSDAEIKEILDTKSFASIAMGVSPGFGSSQSSEKATSGASVGLGVMVDMAITGKLVMGSGLAVNYLNQASESQSYNYAGFNAASSTVTETDEIAQVQVDIPLYFKYPITRNQKVSVQAGFSNLITFNQGAEQESSYTRQVAVYDALALNSFRLQSESVSQTQELSVANQKFYPFATANLGVNIRLFDSKKTTYDVMPFYNYPLQEFSGYGEKLGMFGASFKVNFGAIQKK